MAPLSIIDSHIHLWPESMANEQGHAWMTPGMPLAKPQIPEDYFRASQQQQQQQEQEQEQDEPSSTSVSSSSKTIVKGVIYVETDVRYETPPPPPPPTTTPTIQHLQSWTRGPLQEIQFLRSIITGSYGTQARTTLLGIVAWAPMSQPPQILRQWLQLVHSSAGEETWQRIKGFRFLLQSIPNRETFVALVEESQDFFSNLEILGHKGFVFDVGVDQRSGGIWQLEGMARVMQKVWASGEEKGVPVEERVVFVINHFCKPTFLLDTEDAEKGDFQEWKNAVTSMAKCPNTYMKLSGAFSELPEHVLKGGDCDTIARYMMPWVEVILSAFGPERVMFGSDWPVCNLRGPAREGSWPVWKDVVSRLLESCTCQGTLLTEQQQALVWSGTAQRAYRLG